MNNLRQKSIFGIVWALIEKSGITGVKFILGIILARILTPEDFGLIGMINVFFIVSQVFVDSGFAMAYVQKKQINEADADTVFYTNLMISVLLFVILFFCAPLIADFYNQPQLILLTRVMALVIIINAFNVIQRAKIIRDVSFKKLTKITLISTVLSGSIAIIAAYKGMGVWSLVLQSLGNRTFIAIGFWFESDYKPQWRFSKQSFKEMFSFGSWMLFSNIIRTFFDNIYFLAIGKFFPVSQLGFYSKAKQFAQLSSNNIAIAIGNVAFPVYAYLQDDKEKLRSAIKKFIQHSMIFIVPLLTIFIVVSKPLVILMLTEKWSPMIPYFNVICYAAILYPLNLINAQSIIALGKSNLSFIVELGRNVLRLLNIFITFRYGIIYMLIGELIIAIVFFFINSWFNHKYINYGVFKQIRDIWKILFGAIVAATFAMVVVSYIVNLTIWLVSGVLITGLTFFSIEFLINRDLIKSSIGIIKGLKRK